LAFFDCFYLSPILVTIKFTLTTKSTEIQIESVRVIRLIIHR